MAINDMTSNDMTSNDMTRRGFLAQVTAAGFGGLATLQHVGAVAQQDTHETSSADFTVGCYTRPWDKFDFRVALDAIAEAGFEHCGLMSTKPDEGSRSRFVISSQTTPEEAHTIGEEVRSRGLQIPSVYPGNINVGRSLEAGIDDLRKIIRACAAAKSKSVLLGGTSNEKLHNVYYKAIAECCDYAAEHQLKLTIKPHGGLNATGTQCRRAVETVGHKNFGVWYDPGNILFYSSGKISPLEDVAALNGLVMGMCIKDFQMQADKPDSKTVWTSPGSGMVDFPALLRRMRSGGFTRGALVVETFARAAQPTEADLPGLLSEAKKACQFVKTLVQQVRG